MKFELSDRKMASERVLEVVVIGAGLSLCLRLDRLLTIDVKVQLDCFWPRASNRCGTRRFSTPLHKTDDGPSMALNAQYLREKIPAHIRLVLANGA